MQHGLPDCSGVAVGLDRLLMLRLGRGDLDSVLSFSLQRC
jgi:lysyl-tRNA synthetase class 2